MSCNAANICIYCQSFHPVEKFRKKKRLAKAIPFVLRE